MRSDSLALLQQIRDLAENSKSLGPSDEDLVKSAFGKILESGDTYSVTELENWFTSQKNAWEQPVIDRIMNIAHYQKSKFDASNKFRMISDGSECGCGGSH
ncbi:MAG: hypothetical protein KGI27_00875 [Thaumarchaeota archaeon]|nr:hypothetical protein [Nitrososphaerota archaeon]